MPTKVIDSYILIRNLLISYFKISVVIIILQFSPLYIAFKKLDQKTATCNCQ